MNRKLFRVITVVLAVLIVGQLLNLALQIHSDVYHYSYDEDTFLYTIQDGRYSERRRRSAGRDGTRKSRCAASGVLAVADYYEAASIYYMYLQNGDAEKSRKASDRYENCTVRHG